MWDKAHLEQMVRMSEAAKATMNTEMDKFNEMFKGVMANAPLEHRGILEKVQSTMNKAVILAKDGKTVEANQIIKDLQNECQNNQT